MIIDGDDSGDSQNALDIIYSITGIYRAPTMGVNNFGGSTNMVYALVEFIRE